MRTVIQVEPETNTPANEVIVFVWANFWDDDPQKTTAFTNEVELAFVSNPDFKVSKEKETLKDLSVPLKGWLIFTFARVVFYSLFLILIWEIPSMFYSQNTQEMVFDPIRSDWERELADAKYMGEHLKAVRINIQYSFAFSRKLRQSVSRIIICRNLPADSPDIHGQFS